MAVYYLLASFDLEFVGLLEFGEQDLKDFDFVLECEDEGVAVRVDGSSIQSAFIGIIWIHKITAQHTLIPLNTPKSNRIVACKQHILFTSRYGDTAITILIAAADIYLVEN